MKIAKFSINRLKVLLFFVIPLLSFSFLKIGSLIASASSLDLPVISVPILALIQIASLAATAAATYFSNKSYVYWQYETVFVIATFLASSTALTQLVANVSFDEYLSAIALISYQGIIAISAIFAILIGGLIETLVIMHQVKAAKNKNV